jgi:hypothetical protein
MSDQTDEQGLMLHEGVQLPTTPNLRRQLKLGLAAILSEPRPDVVGPEDTFALQRRLAAVSETAKEYGRAFTAFEREDVRPAIAEILADAVGEQDGIPNSGLTIPDTDGTDIRIGVVSETEYEIDPEMVFQAVSMQVMTEASDPVTAMFRAEFDGDGATAQLLLSGLLVEVCKQAVALGKFTPQVSKVRAYAKEVARVEGGDTTAAVMTAAIRKRTIHRGITVERKQPKSAK